VTRHKGGKRLLDLIGFDSRVNEDGVAVWVCSSSISTLKGIRLDLQSGFRERSVWCWYNRVD